MLRLRSLIIVLAALFALQTAKAAKTPTIVWDMPEEEMLKIFDGDPTAKASRFDIEQLSRYRFEGDTVKLLVILINWSNRVGSYPAETFDSMLFLHDIYPTGSLADFYDEVSYGQTTIGGEVVGWYNAGNYNPNDYYDQFEAALYALDDQVDYSQFDGNGDGQVDAVMFVRSGTGREDTQDDNDIWSFAAGFSLPGLGPLDGVYVDRFSTCPELRPLPDSTYPIFLSGDDTLNTISVFAHELGHNIGLPDLYDYDAKLDTATYTTWGDDNDHPMVNWCLMAYGGYMVMHTGKPPKHFSGWCRKELGWIEPIVLEDFEGEVVIKNIESYRDSSLYLVTIDAPTAEYFLLEYRNPYHDGYFGHVDGDYSVWLWPNLSYGADTLDRGLQITHVHDSLFWHWYRMNDGPPTFSHYSVILEDAGFNPAMDHTMNPEGHVTDSAQWWWPYETRLGALWSDDIAGQEEFSPTSYPSSDGYTGPSGITVRVDSIVGDRLYAYVSNPQSFDADADGVADLADNCSTVANPDQADADGDGLGDACDNCVGVPNIDQADADGDGFGDVCDNCPSLANAEQADVDGDLVGDLCDNCVTEPNQSQANSDGDTFGDACDNCPYLDNEDQSDVDLDGTGDPCDSYCCSLRADADHNGSGPDISDLVYTVTYMFKSGPSPVCPEHLDVNSDGSVADIVDLVYLVSYMFQNGPPPVACP